MLSKPPLDLAKSRLAPLMSGIQIDMDVSTAQLSCPQTLFLESSSFLTAMLGCKNLLAYQVL